MDRGTRVEIERIAAATLRDAAIVDPPLPLEHLLQHVELHRDFYDLSNPGFLDRVKHKLRIQGQKLAEIVAKVRLQAVLLFDENRICIDQGLPKINTRGLPAMRQGTACCHGTNPSSSAIRPKRSTRVPG